MLMVLKVDHFNQFLVIMNVFHNFNLILLLIKNSIL